VNERTSERRKEGRKEGWKIGRTERLADRLTYRKKELTEIYMDEVKHTEILLHSQEVAGETLDRVGHVN